MRVPGFLRDDRQGPGLGAGRCPPDVTRSKPTLVAPNAWALTGDAHRRVELDHDRSTCAAMVRGETSPPAAPYGAQLDRSTAVWRGVDRRLTPTGLSSSSACRLRLHRWRRR